MSDEITVKFEKETDLCAQFMSEIPETWTAYPETAGFDILLVRKEDGFQIGVEAKLKLNTKVICQIAEPIKSWYTDSNAPDCRAILIPEYASTELAQICDFLGLTVIKQRHPESKYRWHYGTGRLFTPDLPKLGRDWPDNDWFEFAPVERCFVPDWVPDVIAGDKAPVSLTHWKIGAIKLAVTLEKRGFLTRQDFAHYKVSMSRWTQNGMAAWLFRAPTKGNWIKGDRFPDFRKQHPTNYTQIEADYELWKSPEPVVQEAMI